MPEVDLVENAEMLTRIFGRWPTFHDAEVVRIALDRSGPAGPTLDATVHVWEMTPDVNPSGQYILRKHTLVTLRFHAIDELELSGFNHQNVLNDLAIEPADPESGGRRAIAVATPTSFGVSTTFRCKRCEVLRAEPWTADA